MSLPFFPSTCISAFSPVSKAFLLVYPICSYLFAPQACQWAHDFDSCYWGLFKKLLDFTLPDEMSYLIFFSSIEARTWVPALSVNQAVWNRHGYLTSFWFSFVSLKSNVTLMIFQYLPFIWGTRDQRPVSKIYALNLSQRYMPSKVDPWYNHSNHWIWESILSQTAYVSLSVYQG